ncbi:MAG: DUF1641 domain-containing protein [Calditrichaeota bacterium]|nr:MAG: DUF1641 domain-containing protein [Calditrichota bacterium]
MESKAMEKQLAEINRKLDFITEQMREQQRKQREMQELKHDLIHIGKDVFQAAVTELEEVAPYFDTQDLLHLLKKLLRNTRNLMQLIDQMESLADLFRDAKPLSKAAFSELLHTLDRLDRKGYFEFLKEVTKIVDTIVTSFSVEDVRLLRENITSILLTVKNMTQPEMLSTMDNALGFYRKMDIVVDQNVSYREIIRELRKPEVKRGIVFLLEFVKSMANPNGKAENKQLETTTRSNLQRKES